jgi:2,4-dienoyl-CoA reductase-like NADH-dependent reductase (Old Yellow Enzyme family)/thioredoxin reductase
MRYSNIFQPLKIRGFTFENRIVMPSMGTLMASEDSFVTDRMIDYYVERAKGGAGLILMECAPVLPENTPGFEPGISDDKFIPGLTKLVNAVHAVGGKIGVQVFEPAEGSMNGHADPKKLTIRGPVARLGGRWPAVEKEDIPRIVEAFAQAARRAEQCGFDVIEIHCGHNYLLHQFLSPHFNTRTDEFGGSFENCMKFPLMCVEVVRKNFGAEKPMFMRVCAHDDYTYDVAGNFNGLTLEDVAEFARRAHALGVDVLDVSRGNFQRGNIYEVPAMGVPYGFNKDNALKLRQMTRMPVMAVGRLGRPELANIVLGEGADLVGWGHAHIADPYIVQKTREDRLDDICYCIGCDQACSQAYHEKDAEHISCMRNPAVGRERELALTPAPERKTVLIAGGGPGGLQSAIILAQRGHRVILCEKSPATGGQFALAGRSPDKEDFLSTVEWMARKVSALGVDVRVNTPVTPQLLEQLRPDHLIIAVGGHARPLPVPGGELAVSCLDVLGNLRRAFGRVVVVGGSFTGIEVAEYVDQRDLPVTIVEMSSKLGAGLSNGRTILLKNYLEEHPRIKYVTNAMVEKLEPGKVYIHILEKKTDRKTGKETIIRDERVALPADTVIAAVGTVPNTYDELSSQATRLGIPYHTIGDAKKPRFAVDAIREATELCVTI